MRAVLLLIVLAVLALGSWWLWMAPDAAPIAPSPVPVDEQVENVPPTLADAPDTPQPEVVAREAVTTRDTVDNEAPPLPDDATWLEVTVVDQLTQEPVPDVDVWWSNEVQWKLVEGLSLRERTLVYTDRDVLATRFGWHARTDANGRIRVTPGANGASVMARDATRYAAGYFSDKQPTPDGGHRLELQRELALRVHVVDAAGDDAAGVPLQIVQHDLPEPANEDWYGAIVRGGESVLAVPPGPVDLMVTHYTGMPATLRGVQGGAEVTLDAWPSVDLAFAGIEALPDGAQLSASAMQEEPAARSRDDRRYHAGGRSGGLYGLTRPSRNSGRVENGRITLQLTGHVAPLRVSLRIGRRAKPLLHFSPSQLVAGQPVTVQLSAEELRQAVEELQARGDDK